MKIIIIEDHAMVAESLRLMISYLWEGSEVTRTDDPTELFRLIDQGESYDLILTDLYMPKMDGITLIKKLHKRNIQTPKVVISATTNLSMIKKAFDTGISGFIPKEYSCEQLVSILKDILSGTKYIPSSIKTAIDQSSNSGSDASQHHRLKKLGITKKQVAVLKLMVTGQTNFQIAKEIGISESTVKYHVKGIFNGFGVNNRFNCIEYAKQYGFGLAPAILPQFKNLQFSDNP